MNQPLQTERYDGETGRGGRGGGEVGRRIRGAGLITTERQKTLKFRAVTTAARRGEHALLSINAT